MEIGRFEKVEWGVESEDWRIENVERRTEGGE